MPENDYKSMLNMLNDMQQQINQLRGGNDLTKLKAFGAKNIILCSSGNVEFKKGDVCKVVTSSSLRVCQKFTGSETTNDAYFPGIVKVGNSGNSAGAVQVLIDGIDDIRVYVGTTAVVTGDKLMPSSASGYTQVLKSTSSSDATAHWIAMEDAVADTIVKVKFYQRSGGGGGVASVPGQITSKGVGYYLCSVYGNGIDLPATATNQKIYILQLNYCETLKNLTWVMVNPSQIGSTGGGISP